MPVAALEAELTALSDPGIKAFGDALQPGIVNRIGVRMPLVRKTARSVMKGDVPAFLEAALAPGALRFQETVMVTGLVIGRAKGLSPEARLAYTRRYLSNLDGWATCDLFGTALTVFKEDREGMWPFVLSCLADENRWTVRTAMVWILEQYRVSEWSERTLAALMTPHTLRLAAEEYYISMALAWALSMIFTVSPDLTADRMAAHLDAGEVDRRTIVRTLQKIRDSYRVTDEGKRAVTARFAPLLAAAKAREKTPDRRNAAPR